MLVDPDLRPQDTIYHLAGLVLETLRQAPSVTFDLARVYELVSQAQEQISADAIVLALDFLYLLGLVKLDDHGELTCI